MKPKGLSLVEFYELEVLPCLSAETVYAEVKFTTRRGRYWRGPCPLHHGKDSNFSVDTQTLGWRCFSRCGCGSVLAFLNGGTEPRGRDFLESVKRAAALANVDRSGLDHRGLTPDEEARLLDQERRARLFDTFLEYVYGSLLSESGVAARTYLLNRGFEEAWLEELDLGL